jgi:hypothetical protein
LTLPYFGGRAFRLWSGTAFRVCPKGADYQWGKDPLE